MRYKGMVARHEYVLSMGFFVGEIVNCPDVVAFAAETLAQLEEVMHVAVDNYLEFQKNQMRQLAELQAQQAVNAKDKVVETT